MSLWTKASAEINEGKSTYINSVVIKLHYSMRKTDALKWLGLNPVELLRNL